MSLGRRLSQQNLMVARESSQLDRRLPPSQDSSPSPYRIAFAAVTGLWKDPNSNGHGEDGMPSMQRPTPKLLASG